MRSPCCVGARLAGSGGSEPTTIHTSESDVVINNEYLVGKRNQKDNKQEDFLSGSSLLRTSNLGLLIILLKYSDYN